MKIDLVFLQKTTLFVGLSEEEIQTTLKDLSAKIRKYDKRETVLQAGSRTDDVCLVTKGSVTIENNDMWGNKTILSHVPAGDFFAETYAMLSDEPMLVDAVANEKSEILFLNLSRVKNNSGKNDVSRMRFIMNLLMISSRKNLMLSGRSFHTAPKTARGRIMAYLNSVALKKGSRIFDIPFDRQQMADYLNLERTALSKELGRMKKDTLINFSKNHFEILAKKT